LSDLSTPALSLLPKDGPAQPNDVWPVPPFAAYAPARALDGVHECGFEGLNGKVTPGRVVGIDWSGGVAHVLVPPARGSLPLRFAQFRRLTLIKPLAPTAAAPGDPAAELVAHRPAVDLTLHYKGGELLKERTIGHVEHAAGLFFFTPVDEAGRVLRHFVPRGMIERFEIGARIGEVLVEQKAATEAQVARALDEQQAMRSRKLGDILLTQQVVSPEQLLEAIEQQAKMPMVRIGEALLALGFVTDAQLKAALEQQKKDRGVPLGELLVREGTVSRDKLQTALARKMGYPIVDVDAFPVAVEAVQRLPLGTARRLNALPLLMRGERLVVALEDPSAARVIEEIEFAAQVKVVTTLARSGTLPGAIDRAYQRLGHDVWGAAEGTDPGKAIEFEADDAQGLLATLEQQQRQTVDAGDGEDTQVEQSDNSLVRLINTMIVEAHHQGVSDIHVEAQPGRDKLRVRFRKDGVLKPYMELPHTYRSAMIARLKIMCDLDIAERRKPQDGKINFARFVPGQKLELRLVTIPTANGLEDAVLRLLASARALPLDAMGLSAHNLKQLKQAIERPYGMVLCVGPTGSGKTTTLHAALAHINTPQRKIWTAEDPVEITQPGLRQVQVNPKIDWTFAKALRSFLRADPDVVMVGEIRDEETAHTAIEASLTGHLVLSTLHTNSAPETVTRLLDMGMDPFNFADSLLGVLAQRLVRRLCTHCRTSRPATDDEEAELLADWMNAFAGSPPDAQALLEDWRERHGEGGRLQITHAKGCDRCEQTGFKGRLGLHELMVVDRPLRALIQTHARAEDLLRCALAAGMRTLRQDGIEKVLAGLTTIEEVRATSNV